MHSLDEREGSFGALSRRESCCRAIATFMVAPQHVSGGVVVANVDLVECLGHFLGETQVIRRVGVDAQRLALEVLSPRLSDICVGEGLRSCERGHVELLLELVPVGWLHVQN